MLTLLSQARLPDTWVLIAGVVCLCIVMAQSRPLRQLGAGALASVVLLICTFQNLSDSQLRESQVGKDTRLVIEIVSVPARDGQRSRFFADVLECLSCKAHWGPKRLQLTWYRSNRALLAGETWELTVRLKPINNIRSAGAFDRVRWALSKGLHAQGYIRDKHAMMRIGSAPFWSVTALRERISLALQTHSAAGEYIGLVAALTLGLKDQVDANTWDLLRETGTAHLLSISGLHVSLLAGLGLGFGRMFARMLGVCLLRWPQMQARVKLPDPHSLGLLFSLGVALPYAMVSGFELPVQRAMIMLSVWIVASWRFRVMAPMWGLSLALLLVLMHDILSPMSAGFWLSFSAVFALFYLHNGRLSRLSVSAPGSPAKPGTAAHRLLSAVSSLPGLIRTHCLLGIALIPLTTWFFQTASLSSPLANLLVIPWVGFVVVPLCCMAALLTSWAPGLAGPLLYLAQGSLELTLGVLSWIAGFIDATPSLSLPGPGYLLLCLIGLLLLLTPRGLRLRWLALPILLPALLANTVRSRVEGLEVHVLDVGQGLATLLLTREHTVLYDTGGKFSSNLSQFEATVMPYLHSIGRRKIDTLIVSHGDTDHAFGVNDVLTRFPAVRLMVGAGLPENLLATAELCEAGTVWQVDGVSFSVLHPAVQDRGSDNDMSCVVLVHLGASRILLTGDIEKRGEGLLSARLGNLDLDLMIAPHHGSSTSSGEKLLDLLHPRYVVFAAGHRNAYGFPHADVQLRYKSLGSKLHVTGKHGTTVFEFGMRGLLQAPSTWWQSHRRFWHGLVNPACSEQFIDQAQVLRLLELSQKGQTLCGK